MKELKLVYEESAITESPDTQHLSGLDGMKIIDMSYCPVHRSLIIIAIPADTNRADTGCIVKGLYEIADRLFDRSQTQNSRGPQEHRH